MDDFSRLVLQASQAFGAPAYVASIVRRAPYEVYRWIAGFEHPLPAERRELEALLRVALLRDDLGPSRRRRWSDLHPVRA